LLLLNSAVHIFPGAPNTERGIPTSISAGPAKQGSLVAYGCGNNINIRDLQKPFTFLDTYTNHQHKVLVASYSPSGFYVCSGDEGGNVKVWATNNVDKTSKVELQPLSKSVRDAAWTSDSQRVIVVGEGKGVFGYAFAYDTGSSVGEISGHSKQLLTCAMRPDRPFRIATGGEDSQVNFFQGPPFKFQHSNKEHTKYVNCIRYSPNGAHFVSVSSDKTIQIFDGKTGEKQGTFDTAGGHTGSIYSVAWSPDSKLIATAGGDKTVKIWDVETKKTTKTIQIGNEIRDQQVSIFWAGDLLASLSLSGDINLLDVNSEKPTKTINGHNEKIYAVAYDSASNIIVSTGASGAVIVWDYGVGSKCRLSGKKGHQSAVSNVAIVGNDILTASVDNQVRFTPVDSLQYTEEDALQLAGSPCDIAVSKNTPGLVLVATHKGITVIKNKQIVSEIELGYQPSAIALSPDDKELSVSSDKKIRQYEFTGTGVGALLATLEEHRGRISKLRYSPDGSQLASADKEVFVWDTKSRSVKYNGLVFHSAQVTDLDWNKTSDYLVTGSLDKELIVWDLKNGKRAQTSMAHLQGVTALVCAHEDTIVSVGNDYSIKTWQFKF
jgi:WD40 repeat protein